MSSHGIHKRTLARAVGTAFAAGSVAASVAAAVAAAVAASVFLAASPASAHDELLTTDPAADSTLTALPDALTLAFSGVLATDAGASEVSVTDAAGTQFADGAPVAADTVLTQALSGEASGVVTVLWKVVSSDGHPISGEYTFMVDAPVPTETATPTPIETATPTPIETATATPTPPAEPTTTASPASPADDAETADLRPWFIGALVLLLAVAGAVLYLLVSRARRERALAEGSRTAPDAAAEPGPAPGSEPPADR
ncbi:copper resistance CopC family protein [Microbacterium sp. NPDC019599]|uniref:copper resistance CopC family protein n=1 Tax=Microbacterium sp. NPDC019599 TaxID=3154690 RepID=UPI0033D688AB